MEKSTATPQKRYLPVILVICLILYTFITTRNNKDDAGFVIRNYDVQVSVNPDRSYDIVETLDVHYYRSMHGIQRDIHTSSADEKEIILSNVSVDNESFTNNGEGKIRIGDPKKKVKGDRQYVIRYTLEHFTDDDPNMDFVYLNLIGTENSVPVEKAHAVLSLPQESNIKDISLTSGTYGQISSEAATAEVIGNEIFVDSTRTLKPEEGITIMVRLDEGTFTEAPEWTPALIFEKNNIDISMDDHGRMQVSQSFTINVARGAIFKIDLVDGYEKIVSSIRNVSLTLPDGSITSSSPQILLDLSEYSGKTVKVLLNYERDFLVGINKGAFDMNQLLLPEDPRFTWKEMTVNIRYPFVLSSVELKRYRKSDEYSTIEDFQTRISGMSATAEYNGYTSVMNEVWLQTVMDQPSFIHDRNLFELLLPIISLLAAAVALFFALTQRNRLINPVPEFDPPQGMNPPETKYALHLKAGQEDMIMLLFRWASQHFLEIEMGDNNDFTLYRTGQPGPEQAPYEQPMFDGLWEKSTDSVNSKDLRYYHRYTAAASTAVSSKFSAEKALSNPHRSKLITILFFVISLLYTGLMIFALKTNGAMHYLQGTFLFLFLAHCSISYLLVNQYLKGGRYTASTGKKIFNVILLAYLVFTAWLINTEHLAVYFLDKKGAMLCSAGMLIFYLALPFMRRRTELGLTLLEKTLGFRQYLMIAEKDRLEMMLESDPEYFYNILPYAQVLGVSKIWVRKFEGIAMRNPVWARNYRGTLPLYRRMDSLSRSMVRSTVSRSASGGGHAGGGSGGGGVSGW